jgi:glutathione peroxidase
MRKISFFAMAAIALSLGACSQSSESNNDNQNQDQQSGTPVIVVSQKMNMPVQSKLSKSIYDYTFTTLEGKKVKISDYKGKKIMFVNTASQCGYTPQYEQLEQISKKYAGKLVLLGFPSNDFGQQEPGSNEEIKQFCTKNYSVTFTMSQKIEVKGDQIDPIYQWLTQKDLNGKMDSEVKWNFQKYLVNEKGELTDMFPSKIKPDDPQVTAAIEK